MSDSSDPYRSGLERRIARALEGVGQSFRYETLTIPYHPPPRKLRYKPDFILPNGIIIEAKGQLTTANRRKLKHVKTRYPDLDIRLAFSRANNTISKKSDTTYGKWCDRYVFPWSDNGRIPKSWLEEPKKEDRLRAIKRIKWRWREREYSPEAEIPESLRTDG